MNAEDIERVVVAQGGLEERHGAVAEDRRAEADGDGAHGTDERASGGDRYKTRDGGRRGTEDSGLAPVEPLDDHPGQHAGGSGGLGREEREARDAVRGQLATGVETEPAHPQERCADDRERQAVRGHGLLAEAAPLANEDRGGQSREAARHMDHEATREVDGAHAVGTDPAAAPDHVGEGAVDEQDPRHDEAEVSAEPHSLRERAEHQGGGDDREHALEHDEHVRGDGSGHRVGGDPGEPHHAQVADVVVALAEREAVADQHPQHADCACGDHALHQHRQDVLRANEATVEESEPRQGHEQHERGAREHPCRVARVELVRREGLCGSEQSRHPDEGAADSVAHRFLPPVRFRTGLR